MARRRNQSGAEDFMDVVAMLPWWGAFAVALGSYIAFHMLSGQPKVVAIQPGQSWALLCQQGIAAPGNVQIGLGCAGFQHPRSASA